MLSCCQKRPESRGEAASSLLTSFKLASLADGRTALHPELVSFPALSRAAGPPTAARPGGSPARGAWASSRTAGNKASKHLKAALRRCEQLPAASAAAAHLRVVRRDREPASKPGVRTLRSGPLTSSSPTTTLHLWASVSVFWAAGVHCFSLLFCRDPAKSAGAKPRRRRTKLPLTSDVTPRTAHFTK